MAVMQKNLSESGSNFNPEEALDALDRGELVRLLAEVEAGILDPKMLADVLERHLKRHWFKRLIRYLLGR
jgi:hypothetical protein